MEKKGDECGGKSIVDAFDDNIVLEILLNLPLKIKFRCKAVCKRWFNLISTPFFTERVLSKEEDIVSTQWYLLYHYFCDHTLCFGCPPPCSTNEALRLRVESEPNNDKSIIQASTLKFPSWQYRPRVYATHNGLVLCSKKSDVGGKAELFVCNPLIGEWVSIPEPQIDRWQVIGFIVSLNNGSTKFKVVRATRKEKGNCLSNFEVFSSDVGEWRDTGVEFPGVGGLEFYRGFNGVTHDGKLVWRVGSACGTISSLLAYDPDKNECRVVSFKLPPLRNRIETGLIGTSCDRLCYANLAFNGEGYHLSVFVLENYETEELRPLLMTQINSILDVNESNHNDSGFSLKLLAFHPFDMDIICLEIKKSSGKRIVSFNVRTKKLISFIGEEIPKGFHVKCPISLFILPSWPISVPRPISEATSVLGDDDNDIM